MDRGLARWSGRGSGADDGPLDVPGLIGLCWMGPVVVGRSTAVMESSRLQRRLAESAVIGVWQKILFQEVPGGMMVSRSSWEVGLGRWGLVGVHWYWSPGVGLTWE